MAASVVTSDNAVMILELDVAKAVSDARNDGRACSCYQPQSAMLWAKGRRCYHRWAMMLLLMGRDGTIVGWRCY
jgi:hypothetical protein